MRSLKIIITVLLASAFFGCASPYDVKYDYNSQVNFKNLKTYSWLPSQKDDDANDLVIQRIKDTVDRELKSKGLTLSQEEPDFLIAKHLGKKEKLQITNWGYSYSPSATYWNRYSGPRGISTYQYEEGSLILDFVDPGTKKLIWRGSIKAEIQNVKNPQQSQTLINAVVKKILSNFPPPAKK